MIFHTNFLPLPSFVCIVTLLVSCFSHLAWLPLHVCIPVFEVKKELVCNQFDFITIVSSSLALE